MDLPGKVVWITGSTAGIGKVMAEFFGSEGAFVAVSGRNEVAGHEVAGSVRTKGGEAAFFRCDVTSEAKLQQPSQRSSIVGGAWTGWSRMPRI